MKLNLFLRRYIGIANLALACLVMWQANAFANCVDNPNRCVTSGGGCTINQGSLYYACSTSGTTCCQYYCYNYTYSGCSDPPPPCVYESLYSSYPLSACVANACNGFSPPG